tara:strand:- start:404 stop:1684 length:1281 start_codon:yes stop_codon:yes gene_type:complete
MYNLISKPLSLVFIINILQKFFSYSIFFVLAYFLTSKEYGLFETFFSIGTFGVMVFGLQAESAFARFYYIEKENKTMNNAIFNTILIFLFGGVLFYLFIHLLKQNIIQIEYSHISLYLLLFFLVNSCYSLLLIFLRFEGLFNKYIYLILYEILIFFMFFGILIFKNLLSLQYLLLIFSLPKLLILIHILFNNITLKSLTFSKKKIKKYLKYSINIVPVVMISFGVILLSRIVVLNNFDSVVLGSYSMGLRISMAYLFLNEIFRFMVDPIMIKKERTEDIKPLLVDLFNNYTKLLLLFNIIMIGIYYFLSTFLLPYNFEGLNLFIPFLFFSNFLNVLINYFVLINNLFYKTINNFIAFFIGLIIFLVSFYFLGLSILNLLISLLLFYISTYIAIFFLSQRIFFLKYNFYYLYISLTILIFFLVSNVS